MPGKRADFKPVVPQMEETADWRASSPIADRNRLNEAETVAGAINYQLAFTSAAIGRTVLQGLAA